MPTEIEFGSRDGANSFRDDVDDEYLTSRYDRRHKTVELSDDAPDDVVERAEVKANRGTAERESGAGQVPLTDAEKDRIDFSKEGANVMHARSVKALFNHRGLDSWVDHYDPTLEVDEHQSIIDRLKETGAAGGGARLDESAESQRERRAKQLEKAQGEQCEHARNACEEQHPEACEFLRESCGYTDEEIEEILGFVDHRDDVQPDSGEQQELVTVGGDEYAEMDVTPQQAGALKRSWRGYRGALGTLRDALDEVRDSVSHARRAMRAVNAIREANGRDPIEPRDLNELLDALEGMPESIPVVASLDEYVDDEPAIDEQELRERAPERPEPEIPERPEGLDDDEIEFCERLVEQYGIHWGPAESLCERFDSRDDVLEATPALLHSTNGVGPATVQTLAGGEVVDPNRSIRWNRENDDVDETVTEELAPDETPTVPADDGWQNTANGYKSRSEVVSVEMESEKPGNWDVVIETPNGTSEKLIGASMELAEREMNRYVSNNDPADAVALVEQNNGRNVTARDVVESKETPGEQGTLDVVDDSSESLPGDRPENPRDDGETAAHLVVGRQEWPLPEPWDGWSDVVAASQHRDFDDENTGEYVAYVCEGRNRALLLEGSATQNKWSMSAWRYATPLPENPTGDDLQFGPDGHDGDDERVKLTHGNTASAAAWSEFAQNALTAGEVTSRVPEPDVDETGESRLANRAESVDWPEALERVRAQYDDSYGDRVSFASDVRKAVDGEIPRELADEGITQPILRYQDVDPADARNQIEARAGDSADEIVDAIETYAGTLPPVESEREPVHGTGIRVDRSGRDVPDRIAENIGQQLLEADTTEERQRVADENAARLERMGYDAGAASQALEYAEFVGGTDPGDPSIRMAIDRAYGHHGNDSSATSSTSNQQFAQEQQGTLDVGVESEEVAEEKQVTLSGRDEGDVSDTLPAKWREGNPSVRTGLDLPVRYHGGPFSVRIDEPRDGQFTVRLAGGGNVHIIGERLPSREAALRVAREFTKRVKPNEISFKHSDPTVSEGAAAAKKAALDEQDGGITNY